MDVAGVEVVDKVGIDPPLSTDPVEELVPDVHHGFVRIEASVVIGKANREIDLRGLLLELIELGQQQTKGVLVEGGALHQLTEHPQGLVQSVLLPSLFIHIKHIVSFDRQQINKQIIIEINKRSTFFFFGREEVKGSLVDGSKEDDSSGTREHVDPFPPIPELSSNVDDLDWFSSDHHVDLLDPVGPPSYTQNVQITRLESLVEDPGKVCEEEEERRMERK